MDFRSALDQIAAVREGVARANTFRGYRAATTLMSSVLALAASAVCSGLLHYGVYYVEPYLAVWIAAAAVSMTLCGFEMAYRVAGSPLQRDLTLAAVERFLPSLAAGGLLTLVIYRFCPEELWMLPGLWMMFFGLGIHASRRLLPRYSEIIAAFYLLCGLIVLSMRETDMLNPWPMGIVFGLGQLAAAGVLWQTERFESGACDEE